MGKESQPSDSAESPKELSREEVSSAIIANLSYSDIEEWLKKRRSNIWDSSPEKKKSRRADLISITVMIVGIGLCYIAVTNYRTISDNPTVQTVIGTVGAFGLLLAILVPLIWNVSYASRLRKQVDDRSRLATAADLRADEERFAGESLPDELDFKRLWALTQRRIDYYHEIAISQSRTSFRSGQIATIVGFIAIVALGGIAAAAQGASSIAVSVIGVAGAAFSGYIGATFMKAQADASAQLQEFFTQPVAFSKLLGAERLVDSLPIEERKDAVNRIIAASMGSREPTPPSKAPSDPKIPQKRKWPWSKAGNNGQRSISAVPSDAAKKEAQ